MIKAYISFAIVAKVIRLRILPMLRKYEKMCRLTNTTNMIVESEIMVKTNI